jgi:hypothetical protein
MKKEIRRVQKLLTLLSDGLGDDRMVVAERADTDAAEKIKIVIAICITQIHAFA